MRLLYSQKQHSHLSFGLILFSNTNSEVPAKQGVHIYPCFQNFLFLIKIICTAPWIRAFFHCIQHDLKLCMHFLFYEKLFNISMSI